jgi:hypothetical protein
MLHKKSGKQLPNAMPASLVAEMARPRIAKSAKIAQLNLDTTRTPEQPSTIVPGSVDRIIPSQSASQPEKAQIAVAGDKSHRKLRIDNELMAQCRAAWCGLKSRNFRDSVAPCVTGGSSLLVYLLANHSMK